MKEQGPGFSIIIPTYCRPGALHRCLESIASLQSPEGGFEVIVVDDGSPSPPTAVIDEFSAGLDLQLLQISHAGPATARNAGARIARGRQLFFTDDDCNIPSEFLIRADRRIAPGSDSLIAGQSRTSESSGIFSKTSQEMVNYLNLMFNEEAEEPRFLTTNNLIIGRELFLSSGGFDESFALAGGEDREFGDRLVHLGHRIQYAPELVVQHEHPMALKGFCRQQFNYGRGSYQFRSLESKRQLGSMKLESIRFYFHMVMFPLEEKWSARQLMKSSLVVLAQLMVLLGFLYERQRFGNRNSS